MGVARMVLSHTGQRGPAGLCRPPAYRVALIEMHASERAREPAALSPLILALTFYAVM